MQTAQLIDNRYKIIKILGAGLSGEVLSVEDGEGPKALKFLKRIQMNVSKEEALNNFKNEFSILSALAHPGIARILDFGQDPLSHKYFFTSELVAGKDFFEATENVSLEVVEDLVVQALRAMNYLHSRGILHLDIKPQNILVQQKEGKHESKIIDFGLAGFAAPRKKVGTPAYMAPEVITGGQMDSRTDLYSFGVLLYKVLTRENPFAIKDLREIFDRHKTLVPPPPSAKVPGLPKFWDKIVAKLLEKNPTDRYANGAAVIGDINFLANRNYDIETQDTRLSYLPEKGNLVGRAHALEAFTQLFDSIFVQENPTSPRLLMLCGPKGTGKSRMLSEYKYRSQLKEVPVYTVREFQNRHQPPGLTIFLPFCLLVDETESVGSDWINRWLQEFAGKPMMILWAVEEAPHGWANCKKVELKNFSEEELHTYLAAVTGLAEPPVGLVNEVFRRTQGNPLFVTELLKTMLAQNLLLDSTGRWASTTFEDLGINFDSIGVPKSLSDLLLQRFSTLKEDERIFLEWMAVFNESMDLETVKRLTSLPNPERILLDLTKNDLIVRTDREFNYFFSNLLLRETIYQDIPVTKRRGMHDRLAAWFEKEKEKHLFHAGHGTSDAQAVEALSQLGKANLKAEKYAKAVAIWEKAAGRAMSLDFDQQMEVEKDLVESLIRAREFKKALECLKSIEGICTRKARPLAASDRVWLFEKRGDLQAKLDQFDEALASFDEALRFAAELPNEKIIRVVLENHRANVLMKSGQLDQAEISFQGTLNAWRTFSPDEKKQVTNNWLADLLILKKKYGLATELLDETLKFSQEMESDFLVARTLYLKGRVAFEKMTQEAASCRDALKEEALQSFEECLQKARDMKAHDMMLRAYNGRGNLYAFVGDYENALADYSRSLEVARKTEDLQTAAALGLNMANIYKAQKKYRESYPYYLYAINTLESMSVKNSYNWIHLFQCHTEIAETYLHLGDAARAEEALQVAEGLTQRHTHLAGYLFWLWYWKTYFHKYLGHAQEYARCLAKARELARDSLESEELKKFQEEGKAATLKSPAAETKSFPWGLKTMNDAKKNISVNELETILQINKFLNTEHDLKQLLHMVLNYALELSGAESGLVLLMSEKGELNIVAQVNTAVDAALSKTSMTVAKKVLETGELLISADAGVDVRLEESESVVINELKSILCAPLKSRNKIVGVLYLDNRYRASAFDKVNALVLNAYCDQVGIALENARLITGYRKNEGTLKAELTKTTEELAEAKQALISETSVSMMRYSYDQIIARSKPMRDVFRMLDKITETNLSVFLLGASGTGKELIARALHYNNPTRAKARFVAINCGAIPANLMESELFGHKSGSFTGAQKDKKGLFEEASGGTLFLDEVAELEMNLQVKLLRVLQEGEIQRLGDTNTIRVDVRVVSASHKNIEEMVKKGTFREDLFYRLCQMKICLPPLAERREDIPLLVDHFIEKFRKDNKVKEVLKVAPQLMKVFLQYAWPGNVRELENVMAVACALREGSCLDVNSLPPGYGISEQVKHLVSVSDLNGGMNVSASQVPIDAKNIFDARKTWADYETLIIAKCFEANEFKKGPTAEMLGLSTTTLYKKIKENNLEDKQAGIYRDPFVYSSGSDLKSYIPKIFKAALTVAGEHPYAAIRQLGVSQGYFYKIIKMV